MRKCRKCHLFLVTFLLFLALASCNTIHVSSTRGNDNNPGTPEHPVLTIERAVVISTSPSLILMEQGEYKSENITLHKKLKFLGKPNEQVKLVQNALTMFHISSGEEIAFENLHIIGRWSPIISNHSKQVTFSKVTFDLGVGDGKRLVFHNTQSVVITDCIFLQEGNPASSGILFENVAHVQIERSSFRRNCLGFYGVDTLFMNSTFFTNAVLYMGIWFRPGIKSFKIHHTTVNGGVGRSGFMISNSQGIISHSKFSNCSVGYDQFGGGLYFQKAVATVEFTEISLNSVGPGYGGGFWCEDSKLNFQDSLIERNRAGYGGAGACRRCEIKHQNSIFRENYGQHPGNCPGIPSSMDFLS